MGSGENEVLLWRWGEVDSGIFDEFERKERVGEPGIQNAVILFY